MSHRALSQQQFYLRSGRVPSDERSNNWTGGPREKGVSVYEMDDHSAPVTPPDGEWAHEDKHQRMNRARQGDEDTRFTVVTGRRVGTGHDGEPLLRGVKEVGVWHPDLQVVHPRQKRRAQADSA